MDYNQKVHDRQASFRVARDLGAAGANLFKHPAGYCAVSAEQSRVAVERVVELYCLTRSSPGWHEATVHQFLGFFKGQVGTEGAHGLDDLDLLGTDILQAHVLLGLFFAFFRYLLTLLGASPCTCTSSHNWPACCSSAP